MIVKASGGSTIVKPKLYTTASLSSIMQAEQQDRFLQLGELSQLTAFFSSGNRRLEVAELISANADFLISQAASKIFVGGSTISYLERPQASFLDNDIIDKNLNIQSISGSASTNFLENVSSSLFDSGESLPPGFKPINVVKYGSNRMKKSLRDLDWFLRYLTYSIIAGDTNILSVNIRGLRELIDNACSSAAAIVALREMRKACISLFNDNLDSQKLVADYFNILISEFESAKLGDKIYKRSFKDLQGLRLPQIYSKAGTFTQKFVMKSSLSNSEKQMVIRSCYRQIFQRDIAKAYSLKFTDLESQLVIGQLSIKEFIRYLGKSSVYINQFSQGFVDTRVVELSFRNFLGRGLSSLEEFQKHFDIISKTGISGLVDVLINSQEYSDYFGEETVPYLRSLGEEAQQSRNWGPQLRLFNYSSPFKKVPDFLTLFADYKSKLTNQHPYGLSNDPLSIQFGAIFTSNSVGLKTKSSFFTRDARRILIRNGPGIYNQISNPSARNIQPYSISNSVFSTKDKSLNINQVVSAIYLRVFGRFIYLEELSSVIKYEKQFKSKAINVREFIRLLVKSSIFRSLYWDKVYICKAIEYLHIKLIGRPTYSRQEINKYFDIAYKKGYYNMVDVMLDSLEYLECFDNFTVPYERYIIPSAVASRGILFRIAISDVSANRLNDRVDNPILEWNSKSLTLKIEQGVSKKRDQFKKFIIDDSSDPSSRLQALRAAYRQVFERDINAFNIGQEFIDLENSFINAEINIKDLMLKLGSSVLYRKEFHDHYPNIKVIELGTKHFLGRAPNNQAEIRYYNQILASKGIKYFISVIINTKEYNQVFGLSVVPYRRFPTLPAANFPNTQKLYNSLTKQNINVVVPSFNLKGDF
uniref:Phycobiliprotein ApcE n=1 Tax=Polysiphonia sertularioides TaxID=945028 RepID=A0A1Z1M8S4_9FLOR|nr:phycobilisome linker polypeptide [Polysiphonia sertularioides]ARW62497.1 phycobilisome linker polypeptide [Polysiphonia sertularioides]